MSLAITNFLRVTISEQTEMQFAVLCPMLSNYWIVNIQTAALSGCVCPINIPRRGNV
jgi:hypothetical protein